MDNNVTAKGKLYILVVLVPVIVAVITHVLNPLIVKWIGDVSPFAGARDTGGVMAEFMPSRERSYARAVEMFRKLGEDPLQAEEVINFRSTQWVSQQDVFYKLLVAEVDSKNIALTRIVTYESDPEFRTIREFLDRLGSNRNLRLLVTVGNPTMPSSIITDSAAIIGFNDDSGRLNHALYIGQPGALVEDIRTMYEEIINDKSYTVEVKAFGEIVPRDLIDEVVTGAKTQLESLLKRSRSELILKGGFVARPQPNQGLHTDSQAVAPPSFQFGDG